MKNVWFALSKQVYVSFAEENSVFLYHTGNGQHLASNMPHAKELIRNVYLPDNLGVLNLDDIVVDDDLLKFINDLLKTNMCTVIDKNEHVQKPINFLPILNLQNDVEKLIQMGEENMIGENVSDYLTRAVLHINEECRQSCPHCDLQFCQTMCCTKGKFSNVMPSETINKLLEQLSHTQTKVIDIIGGDIGLYPNTYELLNIFRQYKQYSYHIWIHVANVNNIILKEKYLKKEIILTFPYDIVKVEQLSSESNCIFHFLVENDSHVRMADDTIKLLDSEKYCIEPVFNGNNMDFFEDNVFLNENDIFSDKIDMREIFCHQKVNTNYFGKLHFFADGSVRANINSAVLGYFPQMHVLELIYEELVCNTAWRKIRTGKECDNCHLKYLCPSPSNYESVIGKENLCKIH